MRSLFNLDNPFMNLLARACDLIVANMLFLLCCLPVVTIGASTAALHKVCQDIVLDRDNVVLRPFFRAFRQNFKQATLVWLAELLMMVSAVCYWTLIMSYTSGAAATVCKMLLFIAAILVSCVLSYVYPLLARYDNTLRQHLKNALILSICKLPRTIAMTALHLIPAVILYFSFEIMVRSFIFWLIIGFAVIFYACTCLLRPVFKELETPDDEGRPSVSLMT